MECQRLLIENGFCCQLLGIRQGDRKDIHGISSSSLALQLVTVTVNEHNCQPAAFTVSRAYDRGKQKRGKITESVQLTRNKSRLARSPLIDVRCILWIIRPAAFVSF